MLNVKLSDPQHAFVTSSAQFPLFVGGFGSGKTHAAVTKAVARKIQSPKSDIAFYEPTWDLIRMIAIPRFEEFLGEMGCDYTLRKSPINEIEIRNYGRVIFRSMDAPQRIIGYEVGDSFVDELDTMKQEDAAYAWRQILARNRQKKVYGKNSVSASTTPEGFRFCYDRWERRCGDEYVLYRAPTRSNPYLPDGYIESLQEDYPKHLLDAYLEGYFVNLTVGTVYLSFSRDKCSTSATVQPSEPIFVGMDFNVGRMSSVIHVKRDGNPHAVDEITNGLDTPHMCRMLKEKYPGRMIYVYPDASGGSRKSVNASTTDIKILTDAGFKVRAKKKNPPIRDRINSMNAGFEKSYKVSIEGCPEYVRCLEQQAYDKRGEPDKTQDLDHLPDAGGYFMHYEYPLIKPVMDINIGMAH